MNDDRARELLEAERSRIQTALDAARRDAESVQTEDTSDVHEAPSTQEIETFLGLIETYEGEEIEIGEAFERLDAGTYGTCEVCGKPIADERLEAVPATRYHAEHEPTDRVVAPRGG